MTQEAGDVSLDLPGVLERIGGDRELLVEIVGIFLETTPQLLARLQMLDAAADYTAIVALAHEFKGTAANLGAQEMLRQSRLLEMSARQRLAEQVHEHRELLQREFERVRELLETYRHDPLCGGHP